MGARDAVFERLLLEVVHLKANEEVFSKNAFEEQLSQDLNERKFTPVQVLQEATIPLTPIWPRVDVLLLIGILLCVVPCAAAGGLRYALLNDSNPVVDRTRPERSEISDDDKRIRRLV
jgi:LPS O-antigen subunit length determinant protein (WzzB/FepE family)